MELRELGELLVSALRESGIDPNIVATFIAAWDQDGAPPQGENLNRLWHLLAANDTPVDADTPSEFAWYVGRLLAHSIITPKEGCDVCGVKNGRTLYRILRGQQQPSQPAYTLDQLKGHYSHELTEAEQGLYKLLGKQKTQATLEKQETAANSFKLPALVPVASETDAITEQRIVQIASVIGGLLPELRHLEMNGTPEQRASLRTVLGDTGMFELYQLSAKLCSERSRNQGR